MKIIRYIPLVLVIIFFCLIYFTNIFEHGLEKMQKLNNDTTNLKVIIMQKHGRFNYLNDEFLIDTKIYVTDKNDKIVTLEYSDVTTCNFNKIDSVETKEHIKAQLICDKIKTIINKKQ